MSYTELGEEYVFFTNEEEKKIDGWLEKHNYIWGRATVCGNCCGFYEDQYWVGGIGGKWRAGDMNKFKQWAKQNGIDAEVSGHCITATRTSDEISE